MAAFIPSCANLTGLLTNDLHFCCTAGLIVGVIIGCITVVIIATFALWFLRHKLPDSVKNSDEPSSGTNTSDGMEVPLEGDFDADTTDASV